MRNTFGTLVLSVAFIAMPFLANANEKPYDIEIQSGKKILNVGNLNLPPTTSVSELLEIFPELLSREGDAAFTNYDVEVNGMSSGLSKQNVLANIKLADLKSIEVTTNPSTSQQNNGQGGVIKLKLKDLKEGVSGSAMLLASSLADVMPGARLNYKKGAWAVRASMMLEYYHPFNETSIRDMRTSSVVKYQSNDSNINNGQETINVDVEFEPNKRDKFQLKAIETYGIGSTDNTSSLETNSVVRNNTSFERNNKFNYLLSLKYVHKFSKSQVETEWTINGAPSRYSQNKYDLDARVPVKYWSYSENSTKMEVKGMAKYIYHFAKAGSGAKHDLVTGANFSTTPSEFDYQFSEIPANGSSFFPRNDALFAKGSSLYLSPYVETDNVWDKWFAKAGVRYQYYRTDIQVENNRGISVPTNHVTAFVNLGYQIAPNHHISMILDRSIRRAGSSQIYPVTLYDPTISSFVTGNPDLKPVSLHNVSLNYITNFKKNGHNFTFDCEFKYINSDRLITSTKTENSIYYNNDGRSNILVANVMVLYSINRFSLSFTGNVFDNFSELAGVKDRYQYFNLSLIPMISLGNGWNASAKFAYNSHIVTANSRLSDYFFSEARMSKTWGDITAFLSISDNFHKVAQDEFYGKYLSESLYYNLHRPSLNLGCHYKF